MAEERIVIVGSAREASVVLDILQSAGHADRVDGFIDCIQGSSGVSEALGDLPVIGELADLSDLLARGVRLAAVASQSSLLRERVLKKVLETGFGLI